MLRRLRGETDAAIIGPGKPVPSEEVTEFVYAQRPIYANVIIEMCGFDLFR